MTDAVQRVFDWALKLVTNLPPAGAYTYARLTISVLGVLLAVFGLYRSIHNGNVLMRIAGLELRKRIRARVDQPPLMTASALRALARGVQISLKCPAFTDAAIAETLRMLALDLEDTLRGARLMRSLESVDRALRELDPEGRGLLSIAAIDRLLAYRLSFLVLAGQLICAQLLLEAGAFFTRVVPQIPITLPLWLFPASFLWLSLAAFRASWYWNAVTQQTEGVSLPRLSTPRSLYSPSDFFLLQAHS